MDKIIKRCLFPLLLFIIAAMMGSCTAESCFDETEAYLKISFYNTTTRKLDTPDSVTVYTAGTGAKVLYSKAGDVQPALIPLDPTTDSCRFIFRINGINDTLDFLYSSYPHFISKECGVTYYHEIDTIINTSNGITFLYKAKGSVTTINEENYRLFY